MKDCLLCDLDEKNETYIGKSNYWTLLVNYMQPTLGSTLLVSNKHISRMADLSEEEYLDSLRQIKKLELALKETFNPDMVNYLMLANVVTHVHFHVVPRYEFPREFGGEKWVDEKFGHSPILTSSKKAQKTLDLIIKTLKPKL